MCLKQHSIYLICNDMHGHVSPERKFVRHVPLHNTYIPPTQHVHSSYTTRTFLLHNTYIPPTQYVHSSYTTRTFLLHNTYVPPTQHVRSSSHNTYVPHTQHVRSSTTRTFLLTQHVRSSYTTRTCAARLFRVLARAAFFLCSHPIFCLAVSI